MTTLDDIIKEVPHERYVPFVPGKTEFASTDTFPCRDHCTRCALESYAARERELRAKEEIEFSLLRSLLRTIHLAGTHGMSNREVADRVAELENTSDQARQYIQNAQQREHRINELETAEREWLKKVEGLRDDMRQSINSSRNDTARYVFADIVRRLSALLEEVNDAVKR